MGAETRVGRIGIVNVPLTPQGIVSIGGEQWTAELEEGEVESLPRGARVEVTRLAGLKLMVRKLDSKPKN
jgi:membrane protein implicated in regulation of membrane protease activity